MITRDKLAGIIDHTLLKADTDTDSVARICKEAVEYGFGAVCVNPYFSKFAAKELQGSGIKVCVVVGFPLGSMLTRIKAAEAKQAVKDGASEIDMVACVSALKSGDAGYYEKDIRKVARVISGKAILKVIIETCFLNDAEKKLACEISERAGAHFVKTSTGFGSGGAKTEDVSLMRSVVGPDIGVKASGGIKTLDDALAMIEAGAARIGTSSGISILKEYDERMR